MRRGGNIAVSTPCYPRSRALGPSRRARKPNHGFWTRYNATGTSGRQPVEPVRPAGISVTLWQPCPRLHARGNIVPWRGGRQGLARELARATRARRARRANRRSVYRGPSSPVLFEHGNKLSLEFLASALADKPVSIFFWRRHAVFQASLNRFSYARWLGETYAGFCRGSSAGSTPWAMAPGPTVLLWPALRGGFPPPCHDPSCWPSSCFHAEQIRSS